MSGIWGTLRTDGRPLPVVIREEEGKLAQIAGGEAISLLRLISLPALKMWNLIRGHPIPPVPSAFLPGQCRYRAFVSSAKFQLRAPRGLTIFEGEISGTDRYPMGKLYGWRGSVRRSGKNGRQEEKKSRRCCHVDDDNDDGGGD